MASFSRRVIAWQRQHGRHGLPWQGSRDAYRVWLSEVMLQQTQVATVLRYYPRFLDRFPTVQALAAASLDEVLSQWSGMGYYSRARLLHRCAQAVVTQHQGCFPDSAQALAQLPGIGPSTAAAIAAFCFGERAAILDGNVKRVLARHTGFADDLSRPAAVGALWRLAQHLLPRQGIEAYTQGLMDLGATLCTQRAPRCGDCPVAADCRARLEGEPTRLPVKTRRLSRRTHVLALLWLQQRDGLWLHPRPDGGIWGGLWCLPVWDDLATLQQAVAAWPGRGRLLDPVTHDLTHRRLELHLLRWQLPARLTTVQSAVVQGQLPSQARWVGKADALALGLPAPVRRWIESPPPD